MKDLDAIYTREWYEHDFNGLQEEFRLVAAGIDRWAVRAGAPPGGRMATALDVGCGPGLLVRGLVDSGWCARGFDGSRHAIEYARDHRITTLIELADLTDEPDFDRAAVVVCTEVAEHVEAKYAPTLVRYLVRHAESAIVFTAAPPGQGGHDHVNEQPREYWLDLFAAHGCIEDEPATAEMKRRWAKLDRLSHMTRNVMVLR